MKTCIAPGWPVQAMPPLGRSVGGGFVGVIASGPLSSERDETTRSAKYLPYAILAGVAVMHGDARAVEAGVAEPLADRGDFVGRGAEGVDLQVRSLGQGDRQAAVAAVQVEAVAFLDAACGG